MLCRLRMGAGKAKAIGWMAETMAPLSVAAMGAKLLGLSEREMLDAVGVAYALCSGNVQPTVEGAWSLWVPAGTRGGGRNPGHRSGPGRIRGSAKSAPRGVRSLSALLPRRVRRGSSCSGELGRPERDPQFEPEALSRPASTRITRSATTLKLVEEHDLKPEQIKAGDRRDLDDGRHPVRVRRERRAQDGSVDSRRGAVQLSRSPSPPPSSGGGCPWRTSRRTPSGTRSCLAMRAEGHHAGRSGEGRLADAVPSRGRHDRDDGRPGLPRMRSSSSRATPGIRSR